MRKIISILFILFFNGFSSFSQNNFKPADSLSSWTGRGVVPTAAQSWWLKFYTDSVANDTVIGSSSYTKLFQEWSNGTQHYYCGFRSDTVESELYVIPKDSTAEYLFFDFDTTHYINDIISFPYNEGGDSDSPWLLCDWQIIGIDSVLIGGIYYKNWTCQSLCSSTFYERRVNIAERLISMTFPFTYLELDFEPNFLELKCYSENGVDLYGSWCPFTSPEHQATLAVETHSTPNYITSAFEIYPNPNTGDFLIINNLEETGFFKIYDMQGKELSSLFLQSGQHCALELNLIQGAYIGVLSNSTITYSKKIIIY
ncbi:MAG: T9SS type A sorting domain-containing protein [Crocinitomicaceae bacterium]|nr:T9SS type A sorting domain-containing protein [Crocinitomicaceae bacterium]